MLLRNEYDPSERLRRESDLADMLSHIPNNINNEPGAITQWLIVFDKWSIPDIYAALTDIIKRRANG